jgi:hypothetical protein
VVSIIKFPPPPNPRKAMKTARAVQLGDAPAMIVKIEQINREMLKEYRLPIISLFVALAQILP